MSVCLSPTILALYTGYEAAYERYELLQCYKTMKNKRGDFAETTAFERYGMKTSEKANNLLCIMSTGLTRPGLARSAHLGRMKLQRGYVSKSMQRCSNPLMITQQACERPRGS